MAKRRRRKGFGDIVALPLGNLVSDIRGSVKGEDVLVGAAAAIGGFAALNWVKKQTWGAFLATNVTLQRFFPLLAGVGAGVGLYFADKKLLKMGSRAAGHAAGAIGAGLAIQALQEAKAMWPAYFADIVDLRLAGMIINDPYRRQMLNGMIINDPAPASFSGLGGYADNPQLADLAALSMGILEDDADVRDLGLDM